MSRTRRGSKGGGYDYWGRRALSGCCGHGKDVKTITHGIERAQEHDLVRKLYEEETMQRKLSKIRGPEKTKRIAQALSMARSEILSGNKVMVLFPNMSWTSPALQDPRCSTADEGCYIRATTNESGLKSVAIDTLILVANDDTTWNARGEMFARERLATSINAQVIILGDS